MLIFKKILIRNRTKLCNLIFAAYICILFYRPVFVIPALCKRHVHSHWAAYHFVMVCTGVTVTRQSTNLILAVEIHKKDNLIESCYPKIVRTFYVNHTGLECWQITFKPIKQ